jgi:DNA-binding transcriptional MocR family regulator
MIKIRAVMDQHSPAIDQATLARFPYRGVFPESHQADAKTLLRSERFLTEQFNHLLGDSFILRPPEAGLHFVAWLRRQTDMTLIMRACAEVGLRPMPLSSFCIRAKLAPALTFGFAAWSRAQIRESLAKFASALNSKLN